MRDLQEFRLGVAQCSCAVGDLSVNLDRIAALAERACEQDADVLVLPELSLTGYTVGTCFDKVALRLDRPSPALRRVAQLSQHIALSAGFVEETADGLFFNSVGFWHRGQLLGLHRKVYLPNYGRFDEGKWFARGRDVRAFDTPWGRFAMLVCADAWHPELPYLAAHDGADVLLIMAASADQSLSPDINTLAGWHRLNQTHALTLGAYVAFANHCGAEGEICFTGGSQVVDPLGAVACELDADAGVSVASVSSAVLRQQRLTMPFRRDDDLELTVQLAGAVAARRTNRQSANHLLEHVVDQTHEELIEQNTSVLARIGYDRQAAPRRSDPVTHTR